MAALHALGVLDSESEAQFDALVTLAAQACGMPISAISLIDENRQWFKAITGLDAAETERDVAFCAHAIHSDALLEVPDARLDARFADNPLVTGDPQIRFYAGAPLVLTGGERVGTLCVVNTEPGALTPAQRRTLTELANVTALALQARRNAQLAQEALAERDALVERLRDKRTRLEALVDASGAGTLEWHVQTGEVRVNVGWAQMLGLPADAPRPVHLDDLRVFVHPEDRLISRTRFEAHFAGQLDLYDCELRMRHADGHWVWVHVRGKLISRTPNGAPEWFYGLHTDISTRKANELALQESRDIIDRTGRTAGIGGWHVDLHDSSVHWSDQTCRIHGVPPGFKPDLAGAINFYAPEARPVIQKAVEHAMATGEGWDLELPFIQADGTPIWVRATGQVQMEAGTPRRLIGAFQDITERKHAQLALNRERDLLRTMLMALEQEHELLRVTLESIGDGVITTNAEGEISWMNPVACALTGLRNDQAAGKPVSTVFRVLDAQTREPVRDPISHALERKAVVALADNAILCSANGLEYGVEDSAAPILSKDGVVVGAVLVFHDVTEQRLALRSLREREVAERANAAKTEFLSRLSHELRTPLNAILGFSNLMQAQGDAPEHERAEWLAHVRTAGNHLLGLVDDVLDVSRIEAGAMQLSIEPVNLYDLAEEVARLLRPQAASRSVRVVVEPRDHVGGQVQADMKRLRQVLFNLVTNAIKYNRVGGTVIVKIALIDGRCELSVRDQGIGMTSEQVARLFQPFERLGREGDGVGLGLVITRLLVSVMGGAIEVSSAPGIGTEFAVRLPLAQTPEPAVAPPANPARAPSAQVIALDPMLDLGRRTILYIEDNAINRILMQAYLRTLPAPPRLIEAADGAQGIELARTHRPDIILVDLHLPDMHGLQVLQQLQAIAPALSVPMVMLSASAMADDRERALSAGFADYWIKPVAREDLVAGLQRLLGRGKPGQSQVA